MEKLTKVREAWGSPSLWNPMAAALWSILLSPIFGAVLHMKNWKALGYPEKERAACWWLIGNVALLVSVGLLGLLATEPLIPTASTRILPFSWVVGWYYLSGGHKQREFIISKYGSTYTRRSWFLPISLGLVVMIGSFWALSQWE